MLKNLCQKMFGRSLWVYHANSGGWNSGLPTTDSLGGGTWAGNMTSDNINWKQFLNYTYIAKEVPEQIPTEEWIFGAYLQKWGRD